MAQLTVDEASRLLGITPRAVRLRIEGKKLAAVMIGGKWMGDLPDVEAINRQSEVEEETLPAGDDDDETTASALASVPSGALPEAFRALTTSLSEVGRLSHQVGVLEERLEQMGANQGLYEPRQNWL